MLKLFQPFSLWLGRLYAMDFVPADPLMTSWNNYFALDFAFSILLCFFYTVKKVLQSPKTGQKFFANFLKKKGMSFMSQTYEFVCEQYNLSYTHLELLKTLQECLMHFLSG